MARGKQQLRPAGFVFGKFQEKFPLVETVSQMPDVPRYEMAVGACH